MNTRRMLWPVCCLMLCNVATALGQVPHVEKVEPPNWWAGMKLNRIELMLYGDNLQNVEATVEQPGVRIHKATSAANGKYAFVDVEFSKQTKPGELTFRLSNKQSEAIDFVFPVLRRETAGPRHQGFGPEDIVYLITPDRFANGDPTNDRATGLLDDFDPTNPQSRHGGDLQGVIDHLDYLQDLGITAIWLNPVVENNGVNSYHGYKATDLYQVDPRFGTNATYKKLVSEAHQRGIKIIFDHVANHIGIRHPWLKTLPTKDWLNGSAEDHLSHKHFLLSIADPHADPLSREQLKTFWFVDKMPDLNQRNAHLAKYLTQNSIWWIEYSGLDGIREDTYPYADQRFLSDWAKAIRDEYPSFNIVGEIWATKSSYVAQFQERSILPRDFETHLPAVMDFPLMQSFRGFLDGSGKLRDVHDTYAQDFLFTDTNNLLVFADNHDTPRIMFEANGNKDKVKLILTLLLTSRGIPQILYGTELGMLGGQSHVELRADFPGGFPTHKRSAFVANQRTPLENEMHTHVRSLLKLRRENRAISHGSMMHYAPTWNSDVYKIIKTAGKQKFIVLANGHESARTVSLSDQTHHIGQGSLVDAITHKAIINPNEITMPAYGSRVLRIVSTASEN